MDDVLKGRLIVFREITKNMLSELEKEEYDKLEIFLKERENIIDILKSSSFSQDDFKNICKELQLIDLEQKLTNMMNEKRHRVRTEMEKTNSVRKANNNYQKSFKPDSLFFNKKI